MKTRIQSVLLAALIAPLCNSARLYAQVSEFHPGVVADGVNYALPATGIRAEVTVRKVTFTPGEYAKYAERFLHIQNAGTQQQVVQSIESINISQYGEPDSTKYYTVKMKDKTIAPMAQLTENGILVSINKTVDLPQPQTAQHKSTSHRLDSRKYFTSEMLSASSTTKMAELAAQEIMDIRESKNALRRGTMETMPKDGASLNILLKELNAQEDALLQLFTGYSDTLTYSETYSIMPTADVDKCVFFRFSSKLGLLDDDDLAGNPYYISITDQHTVPLPTEAEQKKRKITGIVYNMPSVANVKVFTNTSTLYDKDLPFAQFGTIDVLANTLFGKESTTSVTFNPVTGGLVKIEK